MTPLDTLILNALAAAKVTAGPAARQVAAREIALIPFPSAERHGPAKAAAARGLHDLVRALPAFSAEQQVHLASAIDLAARALLAEPDRPKLTRDAAQKTEPYWID